MTTQSLRLIADFIQAKNNHNSVDMVACFNDDATLYDKGEDDTRQGKDAIKAWAEKTFAAYKLTTEPKTIIEQNGETILTAIVSGDFKGSPIEFDYHFEFKDGKITKLRIQ